MTLLAVLVYLQTMAAKDHVAVRLDPSTLKRLDSLREVLTTDWHEATQSDVLRAVILSGLTTLEKDNHGRRRRGAQ